MKGNIQTDHDIHLQNCVGKMKTNAPDVIYKCFLELKTQITMNLKVNELIFIENYFLFFTFYTRTTFSLEFTAFSALTTFQI